MNSTLENAAEENNRISFPTIQIDLKKKGRYHTVRLPKEVTEELAEEVGMHISDGYMGVNKGTSLIQYSGHAIDDFPYYTFRFVPLLKKLLGTSRIKYRGVKGEKSLNITIRSKQLGFFKHKVLGLPNGKKRNITIPNYFLKDLRIIRAVLRGLFDGDGSITFKSKDGLAHTYPVMSYSSISKELMRQLQDLLRKLGFQVPDKLYDKKDGTFILSMNGDTNYEKWMCTIGFNNPKHLTKVLLYETLGMVPPNLDLVDRVKLVRGDIKLSTIYPVKNLRVNNNRINEKKVLEQLAHGPNYISELGRLTQLEKYCASKALRRLLKMGLVECDRARNKFSKKYYGITSWGVNKLHRVKRIIKRFREEFNLAV